MSRPGPGHENAPTSARRLVAGLARPHRRALLLTAALLPAQLAAVIAVPLLVGRVLDRGIPALADGRWPEVALLGAGLVVAVATELALTHRILYRTGMIGQEMIFALRCAVAAAVLGQPAAARDRHRSGAALTGAGSDVAGVARLLDSGLDGLVTRLLTVAVIAVVMPFADPLLAGLVIVAFTPLIPLVRWFRRRGGAAHREARRATGELTAGLLETTRAARALRAFGAARRAAAQLGRLSLRHRRAHRLTQLISAVFPPSVRLVGNLAVAAVLVVGAYRIARGDLGVGELTAFLLYLRRLVDPLQALASFLDTCQAAAAALERLGDLLSRPQVATCRAAIARAPARGEVELRAVRFTYPGSAAEVLRGVSFRIAPGETVALVGPTGAGKSTIVQLLTRAYTPDSGTVLLGGVDVQCIPEDEFRRAVVPVLQNSFIFTATILENVSLGRPGASEQEVVQACRTAGADAFVAGLADGYHTVVGRGGHRLSAGNAQLISLARVCLADPALVVLDEATAALDVDRERTVKEALRRALAGRSVLLIAHRLGTLRPADRVVLLDAGGIVEQGTVAGLAAAGGAFARQVRAWQLGSGRR